MAKSDSRMPAAAPLRRHVAFLGLVVSLILMSGLVAGAAEGDPQSGPDPAGDQTSFAPLDFSGTPAIERAKTRRDYLMSIGRSPDHKAKRRRDATAFRHKDRSAALATLRSAFPEAVDAPVYDPLGSAKKVLAYPSPYTTRVETASGDTQLVQTMVPSRALDAAGAMKPVDLSVESGDLSYRSVNPLVDTTIFKDFNRGIRFDHLGYSVRLSGAATTDPLTAVNNRVFTSNLVQDTDALIVPTPTGVETDLVVRSSDAPAQVALQFDLGADDSLQLARGGADGPMAATGVQIVRGGTPIAGISAPAAYDAEGRSVPVGFHIEGTKLALELPKCGEAIDCPYIVDPVIDNYQIDQFGNRSATQNADPFFYWQAYANGAGYAPNVGPLTGDQANAYNPGTYGFYVYRGNST